MSAAARLRAASDRLRTLAGEATPGPWEPGETERYYDGHIGINYAAVEPSIASGCEPADAAYIAAMDPPLALALADLLDHIATEGKCVGCVSDLAAAAVVADAVLGGEEQ